MPKPTRAEMREAQSLLSRLRELRSKGVVVSKEARQFREYLDRCRTEQSIAKRLKSDPRLIGKLVWARYPHVFESFPIGVKRPDFVVLDSFSGGWDVSLVELEPPGAKLFTKNGNPATRLAGALVQVNEWRNYIQTARPEVLRRLSEYYLHKDLTFPDPKNGVATDSRGISLSDPQSLVHFTYWIVIGRRHALTPQEKTLKGEFPNNHPFTHIATYDRFVDLLDDSKIG